MSMSFNAQQLAAVAGSGGGVEKAKDAAISESTSLDNNVKMEELNDKLGKVAEEEKQGKAVKEAEAEVEGSGSFPRRRWRGGRSGRR